MQKIKLIFIAIMPVFLNSCTSNVQNENSDKLIFKDDKGNQITMSDLEGVTGHYNWEINEIWKYQIKRINYIKKRGSMGAKGNMIWELRN